jgi:hypothetical protein
VTGVLALRRRATLVLLALSALVLATSDGCADTPTGVHQDGNRTPWGDPEKGQFAEMHWGGR